MAATKAFLDSVGPTPDKWNAPKDIAMLVANLTLCRDCGVTVFIDDNYGRCKECQEKRDVIFVNALVRAYMPCPVAALCECDGCNAHPTIDAKTIYFLLCLDDVSHPSDIYGVTVCMCDTDESHIARLMIILKKRFTMRQIAVRTTVSTEEEGRLLREFAIDLELLSRPIENFVPPPPKPKRVSRRLHH